MALSEIQSAGNGGSGISSTAVTLTGSPTAGNVMIACIGYRDDRTLTLPTGFTLLKDQQAGTTGGVAYNVQIAYRVVQSGDGTGWTFTQSGSGYMAATIVEYHSTTSSNWTADVSAGATSGSGTTQSQTSGTTAATASTEEIAVAAFGAKGTSPTSRSYTNSFTERLTQSGSVGPIMVADIFLAATGAQSTTLSFTSTAVPVTGTIATIYPNSGTAPANTVAPAVTGTTHVGQTLTTDNGTWTGSPTSFTYQWQRDNSGGGTYSDIAGENSSTHVLVDADDGCNVRCVVTATNTGGSTSANSNADAITYAAPTNTVAPVASGSATVGSVLSCTTGTWTT